jgi:hypothetical protein
LDIFLEQPPNVQNEMAAPWESTSVEFVVPKGAGARFDLGDIGWTNAFSDVPDSKPSEREPFTVGISVGGSSLEPNTVVPLRVRIRIASGYHIYALDENSKTYTPLLLKLDLPKGWTE